MGESEHAAVVQTAEAGVSAAEASLTKAREVVPLIGVIGETGETGATGAT
jgi:hypothetical protein